MSHHIILSDLIIVSYMVSRRVPPGQGLGGLVGGLLWALRGEGGDGPQEAPEVRCRARGVCRENQYQAIDDASSILRRCLVNGLSRTS